MTLSIDRRALLFGTAALVVGRRPAAAADPILTVTGKIAGGERRFTLSDLEAQPHLAFSTTTPWHADVQAFEGIGFDALLDLVGASGPSLRLTALNDYVVESGIADLRGLGGLVAYRQNGRDMPVSDKGPLFLVFPFDSDARLRQQSIYARCVWQLTAIEVL